MYVLEYNMSFITTPNNADHLFHELLERLAERIGKPTHVQHGVYRVYDEGDRYRRGQFRQVEGVVCWLDLPDHGHGARQAPRVLVELDGRIWPMSGGWARLPKYI